MSFWRELSGTAKVILTLGGFGGGEMLAFKLFTEQDVLGCATRGQTMTLGDFSWVGSAPASACLTPLGLAANDAVRAAMMGAVAILCFAGPPVLEWLEQRKT